VIRGSGLEARIADRPPASVADLFDRYRSKDEQLTLPLSFIAPRKLLVVTLAAFLLPATASAEKILRYSDHEPLGGMRTKFIKDVFFAAIEKESNGRGAVADIGTGVMSAYQPIATGKWTSIHVG